MKLVVELEKKRERERERERERAIPKRKIRAEFTTEESVGNEPRPTRGVGVSQQCATTTDKSKKLRFQGRSVIAAGLDDGSTLSLVQLSSAMSDEPGGGEGADHRENLLKVKAGCSARPMDGQEAQDKSGEGEGAWAPSEGWWSRLSRCFFFDNSNHRYFCWFSS